MSSRRRLELDSVYGQEYAEKYNLKVAKLAFDIAQLIKEIEKRQATAEATDATSGASKPDGLFGRVQLRPAGRTRSASGGIAA